MKLIDSHVHLCDDILFPQSNELIARGQAAGVEQFIVICTTPQELERGIDLKQRQSCVHLVASTTPHEAHLLTEDIVFYEKHADQLVAFGETGLEYFHHPDTKDIQIELFRKYLTLCEKRKLPVVIHCREAFTDFFRIIDEFPKVKGVLHCFTGTLDDARMLIERGWTISLSGIVTFKKSIELHEVAKSVSLDHLIIETDAPYLAPQSKRGKQNEPAYLPEICQFIANLRNIDSEEVASKTVANTKRIFNLF